MAFLEKTLQHFFSSHDNEKKPFLLGLSGGADSTALFYLLLKLEVPFEAAHINHGWREESLKEEELLLKLCAEKKVPLHIKRLNFSAEDKNLEDLARRQRQEFYKELISKKDYIGVLLAHHGDDQAETVLKRLFEGATLSKLKGLQPVHQVQGITYYRPLLPFSKKKLVEWLDSHNYSYFVDVTNLDPTFLRGRFRTQILPQLSASFGKEVVPSLVRVAENAAELEEYLVGLLTPYRQKVVVSGLSATLEIDFRQKSTFEVKAIIKDFIEQRGIVPSAASVDMVLQHLRYPKGKKKIYFGQSLLVVEKQRWTFFSNSSN